MCACVKANVVSAVGSDGVITGGIAFGPIAIMVDFKTRIGAGIAKCLLSAI